MLKYSKYLDGIKYMKYFLSHVHVKYNTLVTCNSNPPFQSHNIVFLTVVLVKILRRNFSNNLLIKMSIFFYIIYERAWKVCTIMNSDKRNQMIYNLNLKLKIFYMLSAINNCKLNFIECIVKCSVLPNISQFEDVHMKKLKHRNNT